MVALSEADKRAIFGADYKEKNVVDDEVERAKHEAQNRRKLAESLTSMGGVTAFMALAYTSGVFFEIFGPYDAGMMYGGTAFVVAGTIVAIAGGQYGKKS